MLEEVREATAQVFLLVEAARMHKDLHGDHRIGVLFFNEDRQAIVQPGMEDRGVGPPGQRGSKQKRHDDIGVKDPGR